MTVRPLRSRDLSGNPLRLLLLGGPGVDPLGVVVRDPLNLISSLELLDRCPRERGVDLKPLHKRRRSDKLHL